MYKRQIMIHVTTTDSEIPPRTGSSNTVLQFSSSINSVAKFSVSLPPFPVSFFNYCPLGVFPFLFQVEASYEHKKGNFMLRNLRTVIPFQTACLKSYLNPTPSKWVCQQKKFRVLFFRSYSFFVEIPSVLKYVFFFF